MSRFADLQKLYGDSNSEHHNYRIQCGQFVNIFAKRLREYLDCPEYYLEFPDLDNPTDRVKRKYIPTLEATVDDEDEFTLAETPYTQTMPEVARLSSGICIAGVAIVLDRDVKSYPKRSYQFPLIFSIENDIVILRIGHPRNEEFRFGIDDGNGYVPAFAMMEHWLRKAFATPPWDRSEPNLIGFLVDHQK